VAVASQAKCTPPGVALDDLTPVHFSRSQMDNMERSYASPEVRGLRAAIDAKLVGDATAPTARALASMPRATLHQRFILLNDDVGSFGGSFLTIQFKRHPEYVYLAWVYPLGSGPYEVRSWDRAKCSLTEQRWLKARYGSLFFEIGG